MLVLFETPAGHALFKVLDDAAIRGASVGDFESENAIKQLVRLKAFSKFEDTTAALASATALVESKPSKELRRFLKKEAKSGEEIAVGDAKLGAAIKEKTGLQCVFSQSVSEIMRGIRANLDILLEENGIGADGDVARRAMVLGLAHSLSRYKLKFSPDKVDTMIVQAISLLDDLDKEINTYAMRLREWYGWHFPELGKIVADNVAYAKAVEKMGMRTNAKNIDFSSIMPEETEEELKEAAEISMGTEISDEDIANICSLCVQVMTLSEYRMTLFEYLKNRMTAIAPNLTAMVGELVGARLISHAGSLLNLAKYPASTVQILGAEKALFRALKTKHATPKYGLIFHASVVGQAPPKHKGKISRTLASKCSLAIRVDALGDAGEDAGVGEAGRLAVESRLRQLEGKNEFAISKLGRHVDQTPSYVKPETAGRQYNLANDMLLDNSSDGLQKSTKKRKAERAGLEVPENADAAKTIKTEQVSEVFASENGVVTKETNVFIEERASKLQADDGLLKTGVVAHITGQLEAVNKSKKSHDSEDENAAAEHSEKKARKEKSKDGKKDSEKKKKRRRDSASMDEEAAKTHSEKKKKKRHKGE